MRSNGISVLIRDANADLVQELRAPAQRQRWCTISVAAFSRFEISLVIHDDFDWKGSDHVLVSISYDGLLSHPPTRVGRVMKALSKGAVANGAENRFDRYEQNTGSGQPRPMSFLMPQPCRNPYLDGDLETERSLISVAVTGVTHRQQINSDSRIANMAESGTNADPIFFRIVNTYPAPKPSKRVKLDIRPPARFRSGLDTVQAMKPPTGTGQLTSHSVNQQTWPEREHVSAHSSAEARPPDTALDIAPTIEIKPCQHTEVIKIEDDDGNDGEGLAVKSEVVDLTRNDVSESTASTDFQMSKFEVAQTTPEAASAAGDKEKKRAKLMLELEKLKLQKKELAIKAQLLDLGG